MAGKLTVRGNPHRRGSAQEPAQRDRGNDQGAEPGERQHGTKAGEEERTAGDVPEGRRPIKAMGHQDAAGVALLMDGSCEGNAARASTVQPGFVPT